MLQHELCFATDCAPCDWILKLFSQSQSTCDYLYGILLLDKLIVAQPVKESPNLFGAEILLAWFMTNFSLLWSRAAACLSNQHPTATACLSSPHSHTNTATACLSDPHPHSHSLVYMIRLRHYLTFTQMFPCCFFRFGFHTESSHAFTTYLIHSIFAANPTLLERKSRELPKFL